jgi:transposase
MMKTGQEYQEKGEEFFWRRDHGKVEQQLVRRLERLGYQVSLPAQPVA